MNKKRRERLQSAAYSLQNAADIISAVLDEEQDSMDNMPENLQGSERYEAMEEAVGLLEDASGNIESAIDSIESCVCG